MPQKRHCLVCGGLIFSGLYCSTCFNEIHRTRTFDDQEIEEWLDRNRSVSNRILSTSDKMVSLEKYDIDDTI